MVQQPKTLTFRIDRGIGQYDFNDYYAVLGIPVTATSHTVRKRYLAIAKNLHPDVYGRSQDEKLLAGQYLSKLVNPAYNVLNQERERTEYSAILKLLAKRLIKRGQKFLPQSEPAQKLLQTANIYTYEQAVQEIATIQYDRLDRILDCTAQLSELNLAYVLLQEGYKPQIAPVTQSQSEGDTTTFQAPNYTAKNYTSRPKSGVSDASQDASRPQTSSGTSSGSMQSGMSRSGATGSTQTNSASSNASQSSNTASSNTTSGDTSSGNVTSRNGSGSIEQNVKAAEGHIAKKEWASALKELRSAIQIDGNNAKCHALLGTVYVNQKLAGMAKVSFQQALKLDPNEPIALKYMSQLGGKGTTSQTSKDPNKKDAKDPNKKGGFFGWLGGQ
jgi:curved DNA-binding protein CbpA